MIQAVFQVVVLWLVSSYCRAVQLVVECCCVRYGQRVLERISHRYLRHRASFRLLQHVSAKVTHCCVGCTADYTAVFVPRFSIYFTRTCYSYHTKRFSDFFLFFTCKWYVQIFVSFRSRKLGTTTKQRYTCGVSRVVCPLLSPFFSFGAKSACRFATAVRLDRRAAR